MFYIFTRLILNKRKQFITDNDAVHQAQYVLIFNQVVIVIESNITVRLLLSVYFLKVDSEDHF